MYKSVSYSNMPMPVKKQREEPARADTKKREIKNDEEVKTDSLAKRDNDEQCEKQCGFLDNLETDDIVLLIVAFVLLMDGCDDKMLLAAIAFIFLSDNL